MKRHLSPVDEDEEAYKEELKSRLTPEQAQNIIDAAHRPNRALYDLSVAIENLPMHFVRKVSWLLTCFCRPFFLLLLNRNRTRSIRTCLSSRIHWEAVSDS